MHEFSLAQSIVDTVIQVAEQNNATQILGVNLEVGEVALVNLDQLGWYIDMITAGTIAEGMKTQVTKIPVTIRCLECRYEGGVRYEERDPKWHYLVPVFECMKCGSGQTHILSGREMHIKDMNVKFGDEDKEADKDDA